MHLPAYVKYLMDAYDILRERYFKANATDLGLENDYIEEDSTPFFLKSTGVPFESLKFTKISAEIGISVCSYDFRKMKSTWGTSHESPAIRDAEGRCLQHDKDIAMKRYKLNQQVEPMLFTQTYAKEGNFYPNKLMALMEKRRSPLEEAISQKKSERTKVRLDKLLQKKAARKEVYALTKVLDNKNKILGSDRKRFFDLVEEVTGNTMQSLKEAMKPKDLRNFIVRIVCSVDDHNGQEMRGLWTKIYKVLLIFRKKLLSRFPVSG